MLHLPELRTLLLHHNCFGKLPEEWDGVPQLYRLGLFSCGVTKLPTNLCQWLGTVTEHRRARTANLADNLLDGNEVNHLFTKFPKLKKSLMV